MQFLEGLSADEDTTSLTELSREFVLRAPRRGMVVVLSDLFDPNGYEQGFDLLRHHRFEPHVIQILDQSETDPKILGDVNLTDVESGEGRQLTVTEAHLVKYHEKFSGFLTAIQQYCSKHGIGYTLSDTHTSFDELVLGMLNINNRQ